ncbi:MAG: hypothetical protein JNL62_26405 [Bryobacterales bacterium]|nr:hypothetical protein [Bryobacterales bacterium]
MRILRTVCLSLWGNIRTVLLFGWVASLQRLCRGIEQARRGNAGTSERERRVTRSRCAALSDPAFVHPDPLIYSQSQLMSLGLPVTWDNPDIQLYRGGAPVPSGHLDPDTEYDIVARIWNNSIDAPVLGLPVNFSYMSFGIGAKTEAIGQAGVNLGVKGGADHPAFARVPWRTPREPGHYCIQVVLDWLDDANPSNNVGQENTVVGKLHSPAEFRFPLRNDMERPQAFRLEVDTYTIPEPPPCGRDREDWKARHDRSAYRVPQGWRVEFDQDEVSLLPGEERTIRVVVDAPDDFRGRQAFNVNAVYGEGRLAGGVTLYVERN